MTTLEMGKEIEALCKQGKHQEAIDRFYSPEIVRIEAYSMPGWTGL